MLGEDALPTVSVIVATRDRPQLLRRTLDAIMAQDYKGRIDCLVVFDQSDPDRSLERDDEERAIRTVPNVRRSGLAGARNTGITVAAGDYIAFCDDDDKWLPEKLRLQVQTLRSRSDAGVAVTGIFVDYGGHITSRVPDQDVLRFQDMLRSRVMSAHPSSVVADRRLVDSSIGLVDEEIPGSYGEDYDWLLRATRVTTVVCVKQPLVRVLWHRSSFFQQRWRVIIESLDYLMAKYPEFESEPAGMARLFGRKAFAHAALGEASQARQEAVRALRLDWRERRAYLALLVTSGLIKPEAIMRAAHLVGRSV